MNNNEISEQTSREEYIEEILGGLADPIHKRLINAHRGDDPVQSMEDELGKILIEVLHREDQ